MLASLACALQRLACRYWAGRVALRETARGNIIPQAREEVKRPRRNVLKSSRRGRPGGAPLRAAPPAPGVAQFRIVRLSRGIVALTHPRTGGAHGSPHRTAGIAGRTQRRGGGVAACGARAAARADAARRRLRKPDADMRRLAIA